MVSNPLVDVWREAITFASRVIGDERVSCSVAAVREQDDSLEAAVLGDCTVMITKTDGSIVHLFDDAVPRLDAAALVVGNSEGQRQTMVSNRERMNTVDGYWIFARDIRAADHIHTASISVGDVSSIMMHTDGISTASRVVDVGSSRTLDDICTVLAKARNARSPAQL